MRERGHRSEEIRAAAAAPAEVRPASARSAPAEPLSPESRYLNRELSWLDFDRRVLALAEDRSLPLLERVRFLSIFSGNLDEFFQVRVAGLQDQVAAGIGTRSPDGRTLTEQLGAIRQGVRELHGRAERVFADEMVPALAAEGIRICGWDELDGADRAALRSAFEERIYPVLTPLAVDPTHPFPYVSNLSLNLGVLVRRPGDEREVFARVKVPPALPRFLPLPDGERLLPIEQLIEAFLPELFPATELLARGVFRVTRDAELEIRERESVDLLLDLERDLRRRLRHSDAVRLEVDARLPDHAVDLLAAELEIASQDVYREGNLLGLGDLASLCSLGRPELRYRPFTPHSVARFAPGNDTFAEIRRADLMLHHPYESFEGSVESFIAQAAADPDVLAIKHTLYRTSGPESGLLRSLRRAADDGKQVVVVVELKARFDEEANIERARALEEAGVHVVYGLVGLKTHAKVGLIVRKEGDRIRRYCHIGTGNYNPVTARLYEDLGLLSASPELASDVSELFNALTSGSEPERYRKLLVAPRTLRAGVLACIRSETEAADGRIVVKVNNLSDPEIIQALYDASAAGVEIDLIVRGICCLRPGLPGISERIRVRSVLGRFLEHSRVFRFGSEARGIRIFIGSADLMHRNLDLRVEALAPVEEPALKRRVEELLQLYLRDDVRGWTLAGDGTWTPTGGTFDVQEHLAATPRPA
jgi:polyphosphate kinase